MSNPPRTPSGEGGTPEVPINAPQGRPQNRSAASGRPQPPAQGQPGRPRPPASGQPAQGRPAQPSGARAGARQPTPQGTAGTQRQPVPPRGAPPRTTGSHGRLPAAQQRQPVDLATRLDGQRGWLAELEQKLKKRSIIALVLTCLAVGVGAAAIYISLTKNADSDRIDALQTRIEALETAAGIPPTDTGTTDPGTVVPETGVTTPDTGVTLPEGTTDGSGLVIPPTGGE